MRLLKRIPMLVIAAVAFLAAPALAGPTVYTADGTVAIKGTDPVAYFTEGKPVEGKPEFTHEWNGVTWQFASAANRDAFKADPEKYAPQYGGFCAWAVSNGYTAKSEPDVWSIVDGKLYLNYDKNIQGRWKLDKSGNIQKADANWPDVKKELMAK